eukprot:262932_1
MATALKDQGNALLKNGHTQQALSKYSDAILISPNDEKLYSNRALCFMKLRDYNKSLHDAKQAIKLNPSWHKAWFRAAEAYKALLNWKCAIVAYYKASISKDIRTNNKLRKFCQKQLLQCQMSYLNHFDDSALNDTQILDCMERTLTHYANYDGQRKDVLHRIELVTQCVDANKLMMSNKLKCKELFGFKNPDAIFEPQRCYGSTHCNLHLMNKRITFGSAAGDEVRIVTRFKEWIASGLCHICQYYIFEREIQNRWLQQLKPGVMNDFMWT